jgi:hypothetical protein
MAMIAKSLPKAVPIRLFNSTNQSNQSNNQIQSNPLRNEPIHIPDMIRHRNRRERRALLTPTHHNQPITS